MFGFYPGLPHIVIQIVESVITCSFSHGRKREDVFGMFAYNAVCNTALQLSPAQLKFLPRTRLDPLICLKRYFLRVVSRCAIISSPQSKLSFVTKQQFCLISDSAEAKPP